MDLTSRILVVDDDPELRRLIADFLSGHGYRVSDVADVAAMRR
jgi:two-component system OmpR family response regulator